MKRSSALACLDKFDLHSKSFLWEIINFCILILTILQLIFDGMWYAGTIHCFVEAHDKSISHDWYLMDRTVCDFTKYTLYIGLCQNTCEPFCCKHGMVLDTAEPFCCKHGMVLDTAKFFILIPVWRTLTSTQGHRVTGKWKLVKFCYKVA